MRKSKLSRIVLWILKILAAVYVGLLLFVFFFQRSLLYHPAKIQREAAEPLAKQRGFEAWLNEAGRFIGWKQINPLNRNRACLLIVHGNAGSAMDRLDYANQLRATEPLDVYVLEYPGYGARDGSPSQKSFFEAADGALSLLKNQGSVYVMGESLGTGVASYLAGTHPETVKGMLLIAPYNNLTDVAKVHMPMFPVSLMLWDRFPSATYLQNYHGPVAMLFAGQDVVVPNRFGHKLFEGYNGPKKSWEVPLAGHDDLLNQSDEWWRDLVVFWKSSAATSTAQLDH